MERFGGKCVTLRISKRIMDIIDIHKHPEEVEYAPLREMPWPVRNDHVWLVTGVLAPDCLALTHDLIPGFAMRGYQLQSFPLVLGQLSAVGLKYNFPGQELALGEVNEIEFRKAVANAIGLEMNPAAGYFIRKDPDSEAFFVMEIVETDFRRFVLAASKYLRKLPELVEDQGIRFSKVRREEDDISLLADSAAEQSQYNVDPELEKLANEVEAKIANLIMQDFPVEVIETWLQKAVKLSCVKVTADYRIFLTDYDKEIKMRQLPKTLFLFFLRHPEGCRLKDLSDHRDELLDIYRKLTISDDQAQVEASIDALVNPVGNSFSEKCAAVKMAFLKEIPERIAKNYFIQGPQGGVKGISLDRELVDWDE